MKFNQDDILESSLKSLKNGIPLEEVLRNLPPEDFEVADLDRLVQAFRALSHPRLSASRAKYQLNKVLSLWDDQKIKYFASKEKKVKFQFAPIFAVLAIILISVLVLNVINHSMAAPEDITGIVMTSPTGGEWTQLQSGEGLAQGSWVRTYADSSVYLVFEDGSRLLVGPQSEVQIAKLNSSQSGLIQLELLQNSGSIKNWVIPFSKSDSYYRIETASGIAEVHGTIFDVMVNEDAVRFSVEAGEVQLETESDDELLESGQTATSEEGGEITEPEYEFALQGPVTEMSTPEWVVSGVRFNVTAETVINGTPEVGSQVTVRGRILAGGLRVADVIELTLKEKEKASFSGVVDAINPNSWIISGQTINIDAETEIGADLAVGMVVKVHFLVLEDDSWLATEIESLEEREGEEPEEEPGEDIKGVCTHEKQHPVGLKLAEKYQVSYEEIMGWFCQNFGFGEIDLVYEMSQESGISIAELFAMKTEGKGWGVIRKLVITKTPKPTREPKATKEPEPTREPKPTKEPKPSKTPRPTRIPKPTKVPKIKP